MLLKFETQFFKTNDYEPRHFSFDIEDQFVIIKCNKSNNVSMNWARIYSAFIYIHKQIVLLPTERFTEAKRNICKCMTVSKLFPQVDKINTDFNNVILKSEKYKGTQVADALSK